MPVLSVEEKGIEKSKTPAVPLKVFILVAAAILLTIKLSVRMGSTTPTTAAKPAAAIEVTSEEPIAVAKRLVELSNFTPHRPSEILFSADYTINNKSDFDVKDLVIRCVHFAQSGTRIDSNERTIYQVFKAHQKRTLRSFDMGLIHSQVAKTSCQIRDLALATP